MLHVFALHKRGFVTHSAKDCRSRGQFNRKLNDPRSRSELIERINEKSRSAKSDQVSDSTSAKMNSPNPRSERSMQGQRGPLPNAQHIPHLMQQQTHPMQQREQHSVGEYRAPFSHQNVMSSQTSGEFLKPWQLQTSMEGGSTGYNQNLFNSRQFFPSQYHQAGVRNAHFSMMQGSPGDHDMQLVQFVERLATNPMVVQVQLQNQIFPNVEIRPSEQGMLGNNSQAGGSSHSSGAEFPMANAAVRQPQRNDFLRRARENYIESSQSPSNELRALRVIP
jgi:hypothetical protein